MWITSRRLLLVLALGINSGCSSGAPESSAPEKNVLLITLDALRQDHISAFGYSRPTTPHIDSLARDGIVFRNVVPSGCSTKASLTSLFTSVDYRYHHILSHGSVLPDEYETLAEVFKRSGYQTAGFVATPHLLAELNYDQGFDVYEDFSSAWRRLMGALGLGRTWDRIVKAWNKRVGSENKQSTYVTADLVAGELIDFLRHRRRKNAPFFLYAHFEEPHPPWLHPSPWLTEPEPSDRLFSCYHIPSEQELEQLDEATRSRLVAKYDGAVRYADEKIGEILSTLREVGELDKTIIAVSTDHGLELLDRFSASHGHNPFDEVVRTFLVINDLSNDNKDQNWIQARIFDIGPTLFALAGVEASDPLQGLDLLSEWEQLPEFAFSKCYVGEMVRSLNYKLVRLDFQGLKNRPVGIKEGFMLFDLRADPGERVDIKDEETVVFDLMRQELDSYREDLKAEFTAASWKADEDLSAAAVERLKALGYIE